MHKELFEGLFFDRLSSYYQNVKDRLVKDEGNRFGYHFSPEDLYVYLIAHEYKHYSGGGTGLRSLLDTYVCLKALSLDTAYIGQEAEKLGIRDFEERNRLLALHVFGENGPSAEEQELLEEICSSGAHGTVAHRVEKQIKEKGRWRYFLSRLTLPREEMRRHYPILKKALVLYPVFWGYRLIHGFFYKRDRFLYQLKKVIKKHLLKVDDGSRLIKKALPHSAFCCVEATLSFDIFKFIRSAFPVSLSEAAYRFPYILS